MNDYGECVAVDECTCYDEFDSVKSIKPAGAIAQRSCNEWSVSLTIPIPIHSLVISYSQLYEIMTKEY